MRRSSRGREDEDGVDGERTAGEVEMTFLAWSCSVAPGDLPTQPREHKHDPESPFPLSTAALPLLCCCGINAGGTAVQPLMLCVNMSINATAAGLKPHNHFLCFSASIK